MFDFDKVYAEVTERPATDSAIVKLEGYPTERIPDKGLYIVDKDWYDQELASPPV